MPEPTPEPKPLDAERLMTNSDLRKRGNAALEELNVEFIGYREVDKQVTCGMCGAIQDNHDGRRHEEGCPLSVMCELIAECVDQKQNYLDTLDELLARPDCTTPVGLHPEHLARIRQTLEAAVESRHSAALTYRIDVSALLRHIAAQAAELALAKQAVLDEGFKGAAAEERANELAAELAALRQGGFSSEQIQELLDAGTDAALALDAWWPSAKAMRLHHALSPFRAALAPTQAQGDEQ